MTTPQLEDFYRDLAKISKVYHHPASSTDPTLLAWAGEINRRISQSCFEDVQKSLEQDSIDRLLCFDPKTELEKLLKEQHFKQLLAQRVCCCRIEV